jgi:hypothetical protein
VKYRQRQLKEINKGTQYMGRVGMLPIYMDPKGRLGTSTPSQRDIVRGAAQVPLDVVKLGTNVVQRVANGNKPADPASTPVGRAVTATERALNTGLNLPQPEQRRPEDLFWQQMGNQFTTGALGGVAAARLIGANAFTQGAFQSLNPTVQQVLRWTAGIGTESFISTALTDNRQGNPANAFGENAPLAVQPTDDMVSSLGKSLLPNAAVELAFGLGGLGVGKGLNNVTRRIQEGRAAAEVQGARNWAQENGIQVDNDGVSEFTPEVMQPAAAPDAAAPTPKAEATAAPAAEPAATAAPAPKAEPINAKQAEEMLLGPEEEGPVYDPSLPEVDTAIQALDRLDDQRLQEAAAVAGPVLPELDRHLGEQQANFQVQEGLNAELLGGPTQNLANPAVPYEAQWQQLPNDTLLSLAAPQNSPQLFEKVQGLTGREFEQFTRGDVLDGLKSLREEGFTVLPNRLQDGAVVMDVNAIAVDPARFQFKDNVNAQGQQKGNSLEGVSNWNPDAEGVIQTWTDAADGQTYVVNGHNRLAKAKELGIGSIRTEEILANTPEQARAVGAIANISSGGGTAFDAAKVIRELGIADPAGLEAAGIPLQSGLGVQGLALSKLPDNLFQSAVNGELPLGRALALGGSGLDPEGMTRVVQLAQGRDMTERGFTELTQMASTAPKVESDQMGLFGPEVIDTTIIKAELAAKVRAELTSNKNLFKKVGRKKNASALADKAGAEVNTTQAQDAAGVAEAVLGEFDQTKYAAETPISQLLNDGAAEIAGGGKPAVIAKRILAQLEKAAETAPPTPKAPVEEPAVDAGGLNERWIKKYSQMTPEGLEQVKAEADKYLLGEKALANRQARWQEIQDQEARVGQYLDEMPGSNSPAELSEEAFLAKWGADESTHPQIHSNQAYSKTKTALERHEWAKAFLAWYEQNVGAAPLLPDQRNELKKAVITRAIQNGEVRPSEAPLPELPDPPRDLSNPDLALQDELRLADHYAQQDAIQKQVELEAQRKAIGYDDMPLEEKKANGMLDTWQPWQPRAMEDTVDTRGQGRFFHGSSQPIEGGKPLGVQSGDYWTETNIFGNGFYATEDFATAGNQYTQKGKRQALRPDVPVDIYAASDELVRVGGATPEEAWNLTRRSTDIPSPERLKEIAAALRSKQDFNGRNEMIAARLDELAASPPQAKQFNPAVYEVVEKEPVRFLDGEQSIGWADNTPEAKALRGMSGQLWEEVKGEWEANGSMSYAQLIDEARGISKQIGYSRADTTELIDSLNEELMGLGYGGMTHQGGVRAGGGGRLHEVKIYWQPEKQIELKQVGAAGPDAPVQSAEAQGNGLTTQTAGTLDERTQLARQQLEQAKAQGDEAGAAAWQQELRQLERSRLGNAMDAKATTQQDMFGVGQYDTSTPLLNQPPARPQVEIPAEASRPITEKTSPGRIEGAAELVMKWVNAGAITVDAAPIRTLAQAVKVVRAKGAILNSDKVPGLDIGKAWDAMAMGRITPEVEAISRAYKQFYGLDDSMESAVPGWDQADAGPAVWRLDDDSPGPFETADAARTRREDRALAIIHRVTGVDDGLRVRFEDVYKEKIKPKEWGGDGVETIRSGGTYSLTTDTMTIRGVLQSGERMVDETAFHESWHRVQYLALSPKEAKVMDTNWARLKTSLGANHGTDTGIAYAETQAVAFQRYASARLRGEDPIYALLGGYQGNFGKVEKVVNKVAAAFDRVIDFVEKVHNLLVNKTFDSTRAIFERGFNGALKGEANLNFEQPDSGIHYMLRPDGWKAQTWANTPTGAGKGVTLDVVMADFDSKLADLKSKALAGGC